MPAAVTLETITMFPLRSIIDGRASCVSWNTERTLMFIIKS